MDVFWNWNGSFSMWWMPEICIQILSMHFHGLFKHRETFFEWFLVQTSFFFIYFRILFLLTEFLQINGLLFFATEILTVDFWRLQKIQMLTMDLMCRYTNYQFTKQHFFYIYQAIPKFRCLFDFTRIFVCLFVRLLVYFIT